MKYSWSCLVAAIIWITPGHAAGEWNGPLGLTPDSSGIGILPFEWSGHWGITHTWGFPGWGQDSQHGPVTFDGDFAHWNRRYAFPFPRRIEPGKEDAAVKSGVWYRRGDFNLDEFAIDVAYGQKGVHSGRFQALKRNFDDRFGLLGPTLFPGGGGTVQQNYRLMMTVPDDSNGEWRLSTAFFQTTDAIPFPAGQAWEKGARRSDRMLSHSLGFSVPGVRVNAALFSQELKIRSLTEAPGWIADLISTRMDFVVGNPVSHGMRRFLKGRAKYSALSSDSLGHQDRLFLSGAVGLEDQSGNIRFSALLGGVHISPDRWGVLAAGRFEFSLGVSNEVALVAHHSLHSLPFQFSGTKHVWFDGFPPVAYNAIVPDSSAISQERSTVRLGLAHRSAPYRIEVGVFGSRAKHHYFFENLLRYADRPDSDPSYTLVLVEEPEDETGGVFLKGRVNYYRRWGLEIRGISFLENKRGWGHGIQHEAMMALSFREFLFDNRLDLGMILWGTVWGGRRPFVWDPVLGLGYEDSRDSGDLYPRDWSGVVNVRFEAVVSNFEIAFTMANLLYAGRSVVRDVTGQELAPDQIAFSPTLLFPSAGRLAFLEFSWRFQD